MSASCKQTGVLWGNRIRLVKDVGVKNKVLANFEGMALGPRLGPRQRLLFLVSDDNTGPTQLARLLVLVMTDDQ